MKTNLLRGRTFPVLVVVTLGSAFLAAAAETPAKTRPAAPPNPAAVWAKTKQELNYNITQINSIMGNPALREVGMDGLARQTGIAAATLEESRRKTAMSYGDLAAAQILANSAGVKLEQIRADHRGRSWADIAVMRRVKLADVNEKLKAVQTEVDKFIDKQEEDAVKRDLAEQRRQMRQRGEVPPPAPPQEPR